MSTDEITILNGGQERAMQRAAPMLWRAKVLFGVEHQDWLALFTEDGIEWDGVEQVDTLVLRPRTLP